MRWMIFAAVLLLAGCVTKPRYHAEVEFFGSRFNEGLSGFDGKSIRVNAGIQW